MIFPISFPDIGRFRTNLFQQRGQWCLAMRYVKTSVPSFEELGLLEQIKKVAESPRGIVLVAGSTGCGKSTTLAAMIEHINSNFKKHIITLEDPIEYVFEDNQSVIEQREIGLDTLSFHHALKHVLRQDPDIIMIGEMRDDISFAAAMSAADTGHLVLSTLHTTTAAQSITRILDFFKAEEREQIRRQLAGTLRGVICQRMVATRGRQNDAGAGNPDQLAAGQKTASRKTGWTNCPPPSRPARTTECSRSTSRCSIWSRPGA